MDFSTLFQFNHETNEKFIDAFSQSGSQTERTIKLFSHVLNAHHIWLQRIKKQEAKWSVWQMQEVSFFQEMNKENYSETKDFLAQADLSDSVPYKNSKGLGFTNTVNDILMHVIIHSAHHRAQIASDWSAKGIKPPVSDYIFWRR